MRELTVVRADPAGNITLFVLTPVEKEERAALASRLMAMEALGGEQVGYVLPDGSMEMAAGEFCGNATRAYGYLLCRQRGLTGEQTLSLTVSGCVHPVKAFVNTDKGTAFAEMPLPRYAEKRSVAGVEGTLVHLGGIAHFVVENVAPDREFFAEAEELFRAEDGLGAYGVCFLHGDTMTPLVRVPEAGTLFFEGSCGSGTVAACIARSMGIEGDHTLTLAQPAGELSAAVRRERGEVVSAVIGGRVTLSEPVTVTV